MSSPSRRHIAITPSTVHTKASSPSPATHSPPILVMADVSVVVIIAVTTMMMMMLLAALCLLVVVYSAPFSSLTRAPGCHCYKM